jgi:hypothetical protein
MRRFLICIVLLSAFAFSGCVVPIPHRRLHQFGVTGRVIDSESRTPLNTAQIASGDTATVSHSDGSFTIAPVYGWHGAYAIGGVGVSLLPGFDVPSMSRSITVTASGYRSSTIAAKIGTTADVFIRVGDISLRRQ